MSDNESSNNPYGNAKYKDIVECIGPVYSCEEQKVRGTVIDVHRNYIIIRDFNNIYHMIAHGDYWIIDEMAQLQQTSSRIEEIKSSAEHVKEYDFLTKIVYEDYLWLINQAEQVEELKKQSRTLNKKNARLLKVNSELVSERDDLRKRYESDKQYYINVQKGKASSRRKRRG